MNKTSVTCYRPALEFSFLARRQVKVLTMINSIVMVGNASANILVIYVLIKTGQLANNTYKLFFMLSVSDLMIGLFSQNLKTTILYEKNCLIIDTCAFVNVFLVHLSMYTIAIIGVDRYLRIKHHLNFKALWTTRVIIVLISIEVFLSLLQATMVLIGLASGIEYIVIPIYFTIDGLIITGIIFLHILTIRASSAIFKNSRRITFSERIGSRIAISARINKKITKLSMRVMLLFCCFTVPHAIMYVLNEFTRDKLNDYEKSLVDFFTVISTISLFTNSCANAILFLMTNVKARRFLKNVGR